MNESLATLVEEFALNPQRSGRAMREILECDPGAYLAQAVDILRRLPKGQGLDYLLTLLSQSDYLVDILWHEDLLTEAQAVELAAYAQRLDRQLSVRLGRRLAAAPPSISAYTVGRILEILATTADAMLLPLLLPFANHQNQRIRSKVALMIGRVNRNAKWVESKLADSDERVRANAVESLWDVDTAEARALLWRSTEDPHHRVAANAMLGLYRLGEPAGIKRLVEMSSLPEPMMRAAAAWAMGECRDARFLPRLRQMQADSADEVTHNARKAAGKTEERLRELSDSAPLRIRLFGSRCHGGDRRELWVEANTMDGMTLPGLLPTAFSVFENEQLVTDYVIQESRQHKALVVGFALPRPAPGTEDPLAAALAGSLRFKNRLDQWALARYIRATEQRPGPEPPVTERLFGVEFRTPEADAEQPAAPVREMLDCLISTSPMALKQSLEQTASRQDCAASVDVAVRSLLAAISRRPGTKHLILLAGTATDCEELPRCYKELADQAASLNIMIHALAGPQLPCSAFEALRKLAHASGGRSLHASNFESMTDAISTLYLSLVHYYRIVYQPASRDRSAVRTMVRVQSPTASGYHELENTCGLDQPPTKTQTAPADRPSDPLTLAR